MSENQRQFPRKNIQIEVELSFMDEEPCTVITQDVSEGGLFIRLNDPGHYTMGDMVSVSYKDPLQDFAATSKDAIIVRHADDGIAIAFIEIGDF